MLCVTEQGRASSVRVGDILVSVNDTPLLNSAHLSRTPSGLEATVKEYQYGATRLITESDPPRTLRLLRLAPPRGGAVTVVPPTVRAAVSVDDAMMIFAERVGDEEGEQGEDGSSPDLGRCPLPAANHCHSHCQCHLSLSQPTTSPATVTFTVTLTQQHQPFP
jgi:hypothetical protein